MNAWCALGLSLLMAAPAFAQTPPSKRRPARTPLLVSRLSTSGDYAIYGHGNSSCAAWSVAQAGTPSRDLLLAWVQGFLTGTGLFNDDQRKTTTEGIQSSVTTYCQTHPVDTIEVAASTLFIAALGEQSAAEERPSLFITPTADNLEAFLAAAMINKEVPVTVVNKAERAALVLIASGADAQQSSGGGRVARCLLGRCGSTKDRGATNVQLAKGETVVWSYTISKDRGDKNRQALAEAIARQLKAEYFQK